MQINRPRDAHEATGMKLAMKEETQRIMVENAINRQKTTQHVYQLLGEGTIEVRCHLWACISLS